MNRLYITLLIVLTYTITGCYAQSFSWSEGYGSWVNDNACAIISDKKGNVIAAGRAGWNMNIGSTAVLERGVFVAKFDSLGNELWAKGGFGTEAYATSIVCDSKNNVFVVGYYSNNIEFDGIELLYAIQPRMFIVKYDEDGNLLKAVSYGTISITRRTYTNDIAIDKYDNIYTIGGFKGILTFDSISIESKEGEYFSSFDIFIAKFDENLNPLWAKRAGGMFDDYGYSIVYDGDKNIYLCGLLRAKEADFDSIILNENDYSIGRSFLASYNLSGSVNWVVNMNSNDGAFSEAIDVALDSKGHIYTYGKYHGEIYFGYDSLIDWGNYYAKYSINGSEISAKEIGTKFYNNSSVEGTWRRKEGGICIDIENNIFIAANFYDSIVIGNDTLVSFPRSDGCSSVDICIAKFNEIGYPQWATVAGGIGNYDLAYDLTTYDNRILLSGAYESINGYFGNDTLINNSGNDDSDIFLSFLIDTTDVFCPPSNAELLSDDPYICTDDSVLITCMSDYGYDFEWHTGESTMSNFSGKMIYLKDTLPLYSIVNPNTMCPDTSDIIKLGYKQKPIANLKVSPENNRCIGDTIHLEADKYGDCSYYWYLNNNLIEGAKNHSIDIVSEGNYKVMIKNENCYDFDSVKAYFNSIPNVEIVAFPDNIIENSVSINLTTQFNTNFNYYWYYEDSLIIADTNSIEIVEAGLYKVIVEDAGCENYDSIPILTNNSGIVVYPNPSSEKITVKLESKEQINKMTIYDNLGKMIKDFGEQQETISVLCLKSGLYVIKVETSTKNYYCKFIVEHL